MGVGAVDIATTNTKLWINYYGTTIQEFNITLSPFTITFSRSIILPSAPGAGLTVRSANDITSTYELIGGGNPNSIKKFTITSTSVTQSYLFNMGTSRIVTGDIIYNAITDTYLIANNDTVSGLHYITEFTSVGVVNFEIVVSPTNIYGLFVYDGENYAVGYDHLVYKISISGISLFSTIPMIPGINGSSQDVSCINITTSTTTTSLPT